MCVLKEKAAIIMKWKHANVSKSEEMFFKKSFGGPGRQSNKRVWKSPP